jgi:hypothetical protein
VLTSATVAAVVSAARRPRLVTEWVGRWVRRVKEWAPDRGIRCVLTTAPRSARACVAKGDALSSLPPTGARSPATGVRGTDSAASHHSRAAWPTHFFGVRFDIAHRFGGDPGAVPLTALQRSRSGYEMTTSRVQRERIFMGAYPACPT